MVKLNTVTKEGVFITNTLSSLFPVRQWRPVGIFIADVYFFRFFAGFRFGGEGLIEGQSVGVSDGLCVHFFGADAALHHRHGRYDGFQLPCTSRIPWWQQVLVAAYARQLQHGVDVGLRVVLVPSVVMVGIGCQTRLSTKLEKSQSSKIHTYRELKCS